MKSKQLHIHKWVCWRATMLGNVCACALGRSALPVRAALRRSHGAQKAAHLDADGLVGGPCPSSSASACEIMCAVFATWSVSIGLLFGRGEVKGSGERTHRSGRSAPGRSNAGGGPTGFSRAFGTKATVSFSLCVAALCRAVPRIRRLNSVIVIGPSTNESHPAHLGAGAKRQGMQAALGVVPVPGPRADGRA